MPRVFTPCLHCVVVVCVVTVSFVSSPLLVSCGDGDTPASDDDAHPLLRVWDLRAHSTTPLAELRGHTKAVLSLSWCPQDAGMLLTCGKDNRTLLWDMAHGTLMYELPVAGSGSIGVGSGGLDSMGGMGGMGMMGGGGGGGAAGLFGGPSLGVAVGRRYEVKWAPKLPGIVASCSFDRTVAVHSLAAIPGDHSTRAPSWLRRPSGASFGFCGKVVSFTQGGVLGPAPAAGYAVPRCVPAQGIEENGVLLLLLLLLCGCTNFLSWPSCPCVCLSVLSLSLSLLLSLLLVASGVHITALHGESELLAAAKAFEQTLSQDDLPRFCDEKVCVCADLRRWGL